jgi:hypothetical protein
MSYLYGAFNDIVAKLIASLLTPKILILDYGNIKTRRNMGWQLVAGVNGC